MPLTSQASRRNIFTVSPNGGDFFTLTAAKNAAQSGDTIVVLPGTYNERNLLKNGVNWWFEPGAIINYVPQSIDADWTIWDDNNTAISCTIGGFGDFIVTNSNNFDDLANGTAVMSVVRTENASTDLSIQCRQIKMICPVSGDVAISYLQKGTVRLDCVEFIGSGPFGPKGLGIENAEVYCRIQRFVMQSGYCFRCIDTQRTTPKIIIEANFLEGFGAVIGQESNASTNGVSETTGYGAIVRVGHINCLDVANFAGAVHCGGGTLNVRANKITAGPNVSAVLHDLGTLWLDANEIVALSGALEAIKVTAGTMCEVSARRIFHANGKCITHAGGVSRIRGAHIDSTGNNNAANVPATATAGGLRLHSCTLVGPAAVTNAIVNNGPQQVKCFPPCVGSTAATQPASVLGTYTVDSNLT